MKKISNKNKVALDSFIFPSKNLPPCFSNEKLFDKINEIYAEYDSLEQVLTENFNFDGTKITEFCGYKDSNYGMKKGVEPLNVNIAKPNGANRILSVSNPLVLLPLHFYIRYYVDQILNEQSDENDNFLSSSKFSYESGFIFRNIEDYDNFEFEEYCNVVQSNYKTTLLNNQKIMKSN